MSVYFVANIKVHDQQEYDKYLKDCDEVFKKFNGEYLAVDDSPRVLEGEWNYTKTVIIRFPNEADLNKWYTSEEYQRILRFRLAGACCDTILVKERNHLEISVSRDMIAKEAETEVRK